MGFGLLLVVWAAYAHHQPPSARLTRLGERLQDSLSQSGPIRTEPPRGPERRYAFDGQAGQKVTILAESYEFNVYLQLLNPSDQQIAWADDNGWFFNARIRATLPETGRYTVIVSGTSTDQFGTYWLSLEEGDREVEWNKSAVEAYYRRGIEWAEREGNQHAVSWVNLAMGQYFRERRQWERAEEHYAKSVAAAERAGFLYGQLAVALERGTLLTERKRYGEAVGELQQALELSKKLQAADQAEAAVSTQLGDLYLYMDRPDLADVHYRNATKLAEKSGSPSALTHLYTSLYGFHLEQDQDKAVEYAQKAYALRHGLDPTLELATTYTLAKAYLMSDKSEEGLKLAIETRRMAHHLGCRDKEIDILTSMSMAYGSLNNIEEMIRSAREAARLTSPDDEDLEPRRKALQMHASGEMLRGNYETALQLCLEALRATEDAWAREPIEELRQDLLSQSKAICTQIIRNLNALNARHPNSEYARQAFDFAERSRSRTLLNELAELNAGSQPGVNAELLEQERRLLGQISAVGRQIAVIRAQANVDPARLDQIERERARLVGQRMQLEAKIRRLASDKYKAAGLSPLTADRVQWEFLAAHPNAAVLFYQLGIQESFLIVLTQEDAQLFKLPGWKTIGEAIVGWRTRVRQQLNLQKDTTLAVKEYGPVAYQLYEMLVKPAARLIQGRDLIIVPDRMLYHLAFEGLVVSRPESAKDFKQLHYLVEDHAVTYAPSVSVLAEIERRGTRQASATERKLLLAGDAVFNERDLRVAKNKSSPQESNNEIAMVHGTRLRSGLHRLPATRDEVLSIAQLAAGYQWNPKVWLEFNASEQNLKADDLSTYRMLHLATHATADPVDGDFSGIILSISQDPSEDGLLTAAEVSRLQLKADLVVLSGCTTGGGQTAKAEGIIGLSRAFLLAGAKRVCASLWSVEDNSTQRLMTTMYNQLLAKGQSAPRALQQAKINLLRTGASPFFWAPFVLAGSPGKSLNDY
jgi:CHAT domain-containing protein